MEHQLTISQCELSHILEGRRTFDIQKNDRDFQTGDTIRYLSTEDNNHLYEITYVYTSWRGMQQNHVILAIKKVNSDMQEVNSDMQEVNSDMPREDEVVIVADVPIVITNGKHNGHKRKFVRMDMNGRFVAYHLDGVNTSSWRYCARIASNGSLISIKGDNVR